VDFIALQVVKKTEIHCVYHAKLRVPSGRCSVRQQCCPNPRILVDPPSPQGTKGREAWAAQAEP